MLSRWSPLKIRNPYSKTPWDMRDWYLMIQLALPLRRYKCSMYSMCISSYQPQILKWGLWYVCMNVCISLFTKIMHIQAKTRKVNNFSFLQGCPLPIPINVSWLISSNMKWYIFKIFSEIIILPLKVQNSEDNGKQELEGASVKHTEQLL